MYILLLEKQIKIEVIKIKRFKNDNELIAAIYDYIESKDEPELLNKISKYPGMTFAIIGITDNCHLIYSYNRMLEILETNNLLTEQQAIQKIENMIISHANDEYAPIIIYPIDNKSAYDLNNDLVNMFGDNLESMNIIQFPDMAESCIGITQDNKLMYSYNKMMEQLMAQGFTDADAIEYLDTNTIRTAEYLQQPYIEYPIGIISIDKDCFD